MTKEMSIKIDEPQNNIVHVKRKQFGARAIAQHIGI